MGNSRQHIILNEGNSLTHAGCQADPCRRTGWCTGILSSDSRCSVCHAQRRGRSGRPAQPAFTRTQRSDGLMAGRVNDDCPAGDVATRGRWQGLRVAAPALDAAQFLDFGGFRWGIEAIPGRNPDGAGEARSLALVALERKRVLHAVVGWLSLLPGRASRARSARPAVVGGRRRLGRGPLGQVRP